MRLSATRDGLRCAPWQPSRVSVVCLCFAESCVHLFTHRAGPERSWTGLDGDGTLGHHRMGHTPRLSLNPGRPRQHYTPRVTHTAAIAAGPCAAVIAVERQPLRQESAVRKASWMVVEAAGGGVSAVLVSSVAQPWFSCCMVHGPVCWRLMIASQKVPSTNSAASGGNGSSCVPLCTVGAPLTGFWLAVASGMA
jgi:hypothetical protein